jgi:hypothetical protein
VLKAITLLQPWATLLATGDVTFDLRDYEVVYRGPIAVHAGTRLHGIDAAAGDARIEAALAARGATLDSLPLGGIVGVGALADCVPVRELAEGVKDGDLLLSSRRGQYALRFTHMRRLDRPIPAAGRGMLWSVPDAAERHLRASIDPAIGAPRYVRAGDIGAVAL